MNIYSPRDINEIQNTSTSISEDNILKVERDNDILLSINKEKEESKTSQMKEADRLAKKLRLNGITKEEQLNTIALAAYRNKDNEMIVMVYERLQAINNKETEPKGPFKCFIDSENPLEYISRRLDYDEHGYKLRDSLINKDPLERTEDFIDLFEKESISQIKLLKEEKDTKKIEQTISKIVFNIGLLLRNNKYRDLWVSSKNKIINEAINILGYTFKNIEQAIQVRHIDAYNFGDIISKNRDDIITTPNGDWYDINLHIGGSALEASLYILKNGPYLPYGIAKRLVENKYDTYFNQLDNFNTYVYKYNNN